MKSLRITNSDAFRNHVSAAINGIEPKLTLAQTKQLQTLSQGTDFTQLNGEDIPHFERITNDSDFYLTALAKACHNNGHDVNNIIFPHLSNPTNRRKTIQLSGKCTQYINFVVSDENSASDENTKKPDNTPRSASRLLTFMGVIKEYLKRLTGEEQRQQAKQAKQAFFQQPPKTEPKRAETKDSSIKIK